MGEQPLRGEFMNWYDLKEKVGLGLILACMVVGFVTMVISSAILSWLYFTGETTGISELLGSIFFAGCAIATVWCFIGIVRA